MKIKTSTVNLVMLNVKLVPFLLIIVTNVLVTEKINQYVNVQKDIITVIKLTVQNVTTNVKLVLLMIIV